MTEEIKATETGSKLHIDLILRLGMYSFFLFICFWFPFLIILQCWESVDGRTFCAFVIVYPFMVIVVINSIVLLKRLFLSLKLFTSQKRLKYVVLGLTVSLPTIIAGVLIAVYLVLEIVGAIIFVFKQ